MYNSAPQAGIASLLASKGRNGDSMLVHMAPEEVKGLQSLALAHGGSLTVNPETGLYEASFLKKLLPTLIGFGLSFIPGVGPLMAAGLVGAGETLRTGDLGKGLMAGLGAYGGAGIGSAVSGVGSVAKAAAGTPGISQMTPQAFQQSLGKEAVSAASKKAVEQGVTKAGLSSGIEAIKTAPLTSLKAVGSQLGTTGIGSLGMTAADVMTPEYKMPGADKGENLYYISGGYSDEEGFAPGYYTKKYPGLPTGMADGGSVDDAKQRADLQQYMAGLNKFLVGAAPASPTYIAPPPKAAPAPVPAPAPTPAKPPGGYGDIDFGAINFDELRQYGFDPDMVRQGLRNFGYTGNIPGAPPAASPAGYQPPKYDPLYQEPVVQQPVQEPVYSAPPPAYNPPQSVYAGPLEDYYTPPSRAVEEPVPISAPASIDMSGVNAFMPGYTPAPAPAYAQSPLSVPVEQAAPVYPGFEPIVVPQDFVYTPSAQEVAPSSYAFSPYEEMGKQYTRVLPDEQYLPPSAPYEMQSFNEPTQYGLGAIAPQMSPIEERRFEDYSMIPSGAIGDDFNFGFAGGGSVPTMQYAAAGKLLRGPGDGMSDDIVANISGKQEARLADGEFVIPADVVSHLGNGSSEAGSKQLYAMMDRVRQARTGRTRQAPEIDADKYLPA